MTLKPGLAAASRHTVTAGNTAAAVGSGEVPVLTTPQALALAERATVAAVTGDRGNSYPARVTSAERSARA